MFYDFIILDFFQRLLKYWELTSALVACLRLLFENPRVQDDQDLIEAAHLEKVSVAASRMYRQLVDKRKLGEAL